MSRTLNFRQDQDLKAIARRWWGTLEERRGDRAELSRATSENKVFECPAYYRLRNLLSDYSVYDRALARMAAVLSRIRRDLDGESVGILLQRKGMSFDEIKPVLRISDPDRLIRKFCGWMERLKGEAPVLGTADLVYWWETRGSNRMFLYDFFLNESPVS